jgi:hypothetical protein
MPEVAADSKSATYTLQIPLKKKPISYDFRTSFLNGTDLPAKSDSSIIYASCLNVTFAGISDFNEYIGVTGISVKNTNRSGKLPTNEIILTWDDPRKSGTLTFENAAGASVTITEDELRNITGYIVYMYLSDSGSAPSGGENYPVKTETNGKWYILHTCEKDINYASMRLPKQKKILLWVGFKTSNTTSTAPTEYYNY